VPTKILIEAVYQNIEYAIKDNLEDRFNSWSIYSWIFNHKYTKQQGRFENLAIEQNNTYALKQILKITAESMSDQQARQLIDFATSKNNDDILQILLESGLLADAGLNSTYTSLQNAVIADKLSIAETLIFHGADTKVKTNSGDNLLHLAAQTGSYEMAKLLVKNGVDAGAKNNNKRRPEKVAKKSGYKNLEKYLKKARKGRL
jgi:ankyrin repeat protein